MASDDMVPHAKPRASPLDFRNTDLVSRLLAATPPYLYNIPVMPNSFFFSEMLKSFVQSKTENNRAAGAMHHQRRSRKKSYTQTRPDYYQKESSPKPDKQEMPWLPKPPEVVGSYFDNKPLELTSDKSTNPGLNEFDYHSKLLPPPAHYQLDKSNIATTSQTYPPAMPQNSQQDPSQNLMLPPPVPMWYPSIYSPFGIDPLHFLIDLRVSGHIYDRKGENEAPTSPEATIVSPSGTSPEMHSPLPERPTIDGFKSIQSRHKSAFSVPNPSNATPMNLSSPKGKKPTKFDVKSMGFEKTQNKTGPHYIMRNLDQVYKGMYERNQTYKSEPSEEMRPGSSDYKETAVIEETEEEREKRIKDLRELIGLELVVDYMNQAKPGTGQSSTETATEYPASPTLEVVALPEEYA